VAMAPPDTAPTPLEIPGPQYEGTTADGVVLRPDRFYMAEEDWELTHESVATLKGDGGEKQKVSAAKALADLANRGVNRPVLWTEPTVVEALTASVQATVAKPIRYQAMRCIANLSNLPANQQPIWEVEACREAIVKSATKPSEEDVRLQAVRTLANICQMSFNQNPFWEHDKAREALIIAANDKSHAFMREAGIKGVTSLTIAGGAINSPSLNEKIWADPGCKAAILSAAVDEDSQNREKGVWALSNFSYCENLFDDLNTNKEALGALEAAMTSGDEYLYKTARMALKRITRRDIHAGL